MPANRATSTIIYVLKNWTTAIDISHTLSNVCMVTMSSESEGDKPGSNGGNGRLLGFRETPETFGVQQSVLSIVAFPLTASRH